jgi:hypothetical protein
MKLTQIQDWKQWPKEYVAVGLLVLVAGCLGPKAADPPSATEAFENDCSEDGGGRSLESIPPYLSSWDVSERWLKEEMQSEIPTNYYHRLQVTIHCLPAMKPAVVQALSDGKITWGEYLGPITAAHSAAYDGATRQDYRRAANQLWAEARRPGK